MKTLLYTALLLLAPMCLQAQQAKIIKLKNLKPDGPAKNFYIAKVTDLRADTTNMGVMKAGLGGKPTLINLHDGTAAGMLNFINSVPQDKNKPAVELRLLQLGVTESRVAMGQQAELKGELSFAVAGNEIYKYQLTVYAQTSWDASAYIGKLVKQFTDYYIKALDEAVADNPEVLLAPAITVVAEIGERATDEDWIVYNKERPLTKTDFKGRVEDLSMAAAATVSGMYTKYNSISKFGQLKVTTTVTPYFDIQRSYWRKMATSTGILMHEQIHFDITAIYACIMVERLNNYKFTVAGYEEELEALNRQVEKERNKLQQQYDDETDHGSIKAKQAAWERKIKDMLAEQLCYK